MSRKKTMTEAEAVQTIAGAMLDWLHEVYCNVADYDMHKDDSRFLPQYHHVLTTAYRSVEDAMRKKGMKVPTYTEHRISKTVDDKKMDYVLCRRCEFCEKDGDGGHRCSRTDEVVDGEHWPNLVGHDDGCSKGIKRK